MEDHQKGLSTCSTTAFDSSKLSLDQKFSLIADRMIQEIIWLVQPNIVSEWNRRKIIDYIRRLIKCYFGIEVLTYGSVPLKAYLPDGDIDVTVFCYQNKVKDLAEAIRSVLASLPTEIGFVIKDVYSLDVKVLLVKCIVNNIAVDISFNQVAGLSTLCFLEQVDQFIGRDHLFKKSIILIKAWCYYESRILGSRRGLFSTYALETLVLYIINRFHSSLLGPLEVLHRFLEFYSEFDWDNYCISITGPIALSSIAGIVETPENEGKELLLTKEFFRNCRDTFSDPRVHEARPEKFPITYLNIVDPLKANNNLGRSVSKGNSRRVRSVFSLGLKHLREKLKLPGECIGQGLRIFFETTIRRNRREQRPDLEVPVPEFCRGRSVHSNLIGDFDYFYGSMLWGQALHYQSLRFSSASQPKTNPLLNGMAHSTNHLKWDPKTYTWVENRQSYPGTGTFIPDGGPHCGYVNSKARPRMEFQWVEVKPPQPQNINQVGVASVEISILPGIQDSSPAQVSEAGRNWAAFHGQAFSSSHGKPSFETGEKAVPCTQALTPRTPPRKFDLKDKAVFPPLPKDDKAVPCTEDLVPQKDEKAMPCTQDLDLAPPTTSPPKFDLKDKAVPCARNLDLILPRTPPPKFDLKDKKAFPPLPNDDKALPPSL